MDMEDDEYLPTRRTLLTRLKNWDDQEGWREFFELYWKLIYTVALRAGLRHAEAEDVVQDTVLGIAKKMRTFHYDPAVSSFRIIEHLRRQSHQATLPQPSATSDTDTGLVDQLPDPALNEFDTLWNAEWEKNLLDRALERVKAKVSAKQFLLFDLCALKQTPVAKITRSLGVNFGQVYLAKHRIARLLKQEIQNLKRQMEAQ